MTYKDIPGTMCDFHDFYKKIAGELPNPCRVVEVGCADGHSAIFLAEELTKLGKDFQMVMVENMDYGREEQQNTLLVNIVKSGLADKIRLVAIDSLNASCKFPDQWAHFVFIDASHRYEPTKADIRLWYRKVMQGCYLAGHDYNMEEVGNAVNEVIPAHRLEVVKTEKDLGVWAVKRTGECF
jgi:cephalosporin hydroxylase